MKQFLTKLLVGGAMCMAPLVSTAATFVGDRSDFRDETIYFVMTTRFYDGDPTNNVCSWDKQDVQISKNDPDWRGDFAGLIEKLDYIKALGFTSIWVTPVVQNASGEDYHGYHAMDFTKVDLRYESRKEWGAEKDVKFQDLIDAAHAKGMKIVLDVVLQHTGNFGEVNLNPLFTRDQNIKNQASVAASMTPNPDRLSANYFDQDPTAQYAERWKYFKNPQYEPNNYYHHYGTGWNWDLPNRWWGQIAGDCVDLNTENDYVAQYIVDCYGEFIKMGVDGFRIDTTGHIAPLTFNKQFIPQFHAIAEQYKHKRLNECEFFMFGECCQRFQGSVVYRDQPNLSSYFYTWKSDQSLMDQYNGDPEWWRAQTLPEGHDTPVGPMAVCEQDTKDKPTSNNVLMQNGAWHEPDYSQYSGFSVIDFPMHYCFNNAGSAVDIARKGDNKYNDASWNVVYVDSHDYCPGPNDGTRFNGGTAQWAENLSLMFSFRGIPCIYYGSEVEFKKGLPIDVGGSNNKTPRSQSGRAYYGNYMEGTINATDFGQYTASGNAATTLNGDLAQHIIRLNQIRAAVPALRKGQYTFDGCSANGGWAFKRAYRDSYALVSINGGATFTGVPDGTYVDLVTGTSYTPAGGKITVDAPRGQGQLRVLVKGWTGGKVGVDGKFIYATSPVTHGGNPVFDDPGTPHYYTAEDAPGKASVIFDPAGGAFKTETLNVSARLNDVATTGWYQIGDGSKVTLTPGNTSTFTIGENMSYGQTVTVNWGADDMTGKVTYRKVDPNATITVYVTSATAPYLYAWYTDNNGQNVQPNGAWPGKVLTNSKEIDGRTFYYITFDEAESVNVIFNNGNGAQTDDILGITEDTYYEWDGGSGYKVLTGISDNPEPSVKVSPKGGEFVGTVDVTVTANRYCTTSWYKIGNGSQVSFNSTATFTLGADMVAGQSVTVSWGATGEGVTKTGEVTFTKVDRPSTTDVKIYFDNSKSGWSNVNLYIYGSNSDEELCGSWPGKAMSIDSSTGYYVYTLVTDKDYTRLNVIFNNGNGSQTGDNVKIRQNGVYSIDGDTGLSGIASADIDEDSLPVEFYNLQGIKVENPQQGIYIMRRGSTVRKVRIP